MTGSAGPCRCCSASSPAGSAPSRRREAVLATPAVASWVRMAIEPLARAGREGYLPSGVERRRLAALGGAGAILGGWLAGGPSLAIPLAVAAPALAGSAISRRRTPLPALGRGRRSRRSLAPSPTRSPPGARCAPRSPPPPTRSTVPWPPRCRGSAPSSSSGAPTAAALAGLRSRVGSPRVDSFCAALLSQRLAGGDLAGLLRRFAEGAAERDRVDGGRPNRHRPGALHRPAGGGDARRGRPVRRAARAGVRLAAVGLAAGASP